MQSRANCDHLWALGVPKTPLLSIAGVQLRLGIDDDVSMEIRGPVLKIVERVLRRAAKRSLQRDAAVHECNLILG
jgi:hypothetical protein